MYKMDVIQIPQQINQAIYEREKVFQWVVELCNAETRENALSELRYSNFFFFILIIKICVLRSF